MRRGPRNRLVEWQSEFPRSNHPSRSLRRWTCQGPPYPPPTWFLTTLTASFAHALRACCIPLPAVGFAAFPCLPVLPTRLPGLTFPSRPSSRRSTLRSVPLTSSRVGVTTFPCLPVVRAASGRLISRRLSFSASRESLSSSYGLGGPCRPALRLRVAPHALESAQARGSTPPGIRGSSAIRSPLRSRMLPFDRSRHPPRGQPTSRPSSAGESVAPSPRFR